MIIELKGERSFNKISLREDIRLGLRVEGVAVDAMVNGRADRLLNRVMSDPIRKTFWIP